MSTLIQTLHPTRRSRTALHMGGITRHGTTRPIFGELKGDCPAVKLLPAPKLALNAKAGARRGQRTARSLHYVSTMVRTAVQQLFGSKHGLFSALRLRSQQETVQRPAMGIHATNGIRIMATRALTRSKTLVVIVLAASVQVGCPWWSSPFLVVSTRGCKSRFFVVLVTQCRVVRD